MSYATLQAKIVRTKIDLLVITLDYCANTYGVAPCTASGTAPLKCFNTFPTCQDKSNFTKTTKTYKFINSGLPTRVLNDYYGAKPYIKSYNELPTEIKEKDTVVKRLKVDLFDEDDNDVGIDPYRDGRTSIQGSFWKKWIARNSNYKGRFIKLYEGYEGLAEGDFQLKFVGTIDNITLNNGIMNIEAVDLLKELSKVDYPLNLGLYNTERIPNIFTVANQAEMLLLSEAVPGDFAKRIDFGTVANFVLAASSSGTLGTGTYYYRVVAYDIINRPLAISTEIGVEVDNGAGKNSVDISFNAFTGAHYYKVFGRTYLSQNKYWFTYATSITDIGDAGTTGTVPSEAERYYELQNYGYPDIANWTLYVDAFYIALNSTSELDSSGYVKVEDELIYYGSKTVSYLQGVLRVQLNTKAASHALNTNIFYMFIKVSGNPFTYLKAMLLLKIDSAYIDSKFDTYVSAYTGPDVSLRPITKGTKLNKLYFDLVNLMDCMSWVDEDGKIKILKYSEVGTVPAITDEANIIFGSLSVDENEESRKTRWLQYWNRIDMDKGIEDKDAFGRLTITIDSVAEGTTEYDDKIEDIQYGAWFNDDSDVVADIQSYINTLLVARKNRTRDAQRILTFDVELKDGSLQASDLIDVTTAKVQDTYGETATQRYRIIKKTPKVNEFGVVNKFGIKAIRMLT